MPDIAVAAGVSSSPTSPSRVGLRARLPSGIATSWARLQGTYQAQQNTPTSLFNTVRVVFAICKLTWVPIVGSILGNLLFLLFDQSQDAIRATLDIKDLKFANLAYVGFFFIALMFWAVSAYLCARLMIMHPRILNKLPRGYDQATAHKCLDVLPRVLGFSVFLMMAVVVVCVVLQLPVWVYLPLGLTFVPLMITLLVRLGERDKSLGVNWWLLIIAAIAAVAPLVIYGIVLGFLGRIRVDHASALFMISFLATAAISWRVLRWLLFRSLWRVLRWLLSEPLSWVPRWLAYKPRLQLTLSRLSQWRERLHWGSPEWTILKLSSAFVAAFLLLATSAELAFVTRMHLYLEAEPSGRDVINYYQQGDKQAVEIMISNYYGKSLDYIDQTQNLIVYLAGAIDLITKRLADWRTGLALAAFVGFAMLTLAISQCVNKLLSQSNIMSYQIKTAHVRIILWFYGSFTLAIGLSFTLFPVSVGRFLRPATVIALFIPILISALSLLSWYSLSSRIRVVPIALATWFGLGFLFDNHFVRRLGPVPKEPASPSEAAAPSNQGTLSRPTVVEAFEIWYKATKDRYCKGQYCQPGMSVPIAFVATAGGGIRAAYWTATVLGTLQDDNPEFAESLFGISGVSGGALGATVYRALLTEEERGRKLPECRLPSDFIGPLKPSFARCGQQVLDRDGLGPTLGVMLFPDLLRRLVPLPFDWQLFRERDRARALEISWEDGWNRATGSNLLAEDFYNLWPDTPYPALFLNGTSVKSGRRIITSNLSLGAEQDQGMSFPDAFDFFDESGMRIRISTAVNNSARFPVIGPAGTFRTSTNGDKKDQVVDGGYFENYGATTALDLADAIRRYYDDKYKDEKGEPSLRFIFVQISSDATLPVEDKDTVVPSGAIANELSAPVWALTATRTARGTYQAALAKYRMQHDFNGTYVHFRLGVGCGHTAPLGWVLSDSAETGMQESIKNEECTRNGRTLLAKSLDVNNDSAIVRDEREKSETLADAAKP